MILTGKALEDFKYSHNMSSFNDYSEVLQYALIIEWLDSVGIYIDAYYCDGFFEVYVGEEWHGTCKNRKEAYKEGILFANEIYNKL